MSVFNTPEMAEYYHNVIKDHPEEFKLGITEAYLSTGVTYDGDPESPRSIAYDLGRVMGEAVGGLDDSNHPLWSDAAYCDHGPTMYESYCPKCSEG